MDKNDDSEGGGGGGGRGFERCWKSKVIVSIQDERSCRRATLCKYDGHDRAASSLTQVKLKAHGCVGAGAGADAGGG